MVWSLKRYEKSPRKSTFSPKWLFRWLYLQFWFLRFRLRLAIIIIIYCLNHLFFPFPLVWVHPGKQSLSKGFKGTCKTSNWHRNCPGECQYQLVNCWYTSIGHWICVITEWLSIQKRAYHLFFSATFPQQCRILPLLLLPMLLLNLPLHLLMSLSLLCMGLPLVLRRLWTGSWLSKC